MRQNKRFNFFQLWIFFFFILFLGSHFFSFASETRGRSYRYYIVQKGDTLSSIGRRFQVSVQDLVSANHLRNQNRIRAGQALLIPAGQTSFVLPREEKTLSIKESPSEMKPEVPETLVKPPPEGPKPEETWVEAPPVLAQDEEGVVRKESPPIEMISDEEENSSVSRRYFGVGFGWWFGFIDAKAQISVEGLTGTEIDLEDDLGVDDSVGLPVVNVWLAPFSWLRLQGEYMNLSVEGQADIDRDIVFNGITYHISDHVSGEVDVDRFSGWVELNPLNGSWGYLGVMIGGEYVRLDAALSSEWVGETRASLDAGTVTLGAQGSLNLTDHFELHGRLRGMKFEIRDIDIAVFDLGGGAFLYLFRSFSIVTGLSLSHL
ncbi:MAG: LysM peptidoglycan-binding domain-containing protein [Chlamydiae bacterium]|nr:LysM peptidoglycan-binding domain-containing protein [Chlamydiota bacterium]MBI3265479.1 LysM peptidoglycan-binding domain-containing protein [Chlamydiota bacterium]